MSTDGDSNTPQQRIQALISEFSSLPDWESRYRKIIQMGKKLPPIADDLKIEAHLIHGCQSQVWLTAQREPSGRIHFSGESDALIVNGLLSVLLHVYSNSTPQDILQTPLDFMKTLGFENQLTPSRANGMYAMIKQMKYYALALS